MIAGTVVRNSGAAALASAAVGKVRLKKELRLLEAVSVIVGLIVGTGIFVSPTGVLRETGSVGFSLLVWVGCGVLSTMGAICYAELGTLVPESGGDFAYIRNAFGDLPAFLFMWDAVFVFVPTANAIMGLTFANYALKPIYGDCLVPDDAKRLVAAASITFLTFLNCWNMKVTKKIQDVFLITKLTALVVVIIAGATYMFKGHYDVFKDPFEGSTHSPASISVAFYEGMFAYTGYNYLNYMIEEVKNPYVNLPRAIYISMPLVTFLYVFANVAYLAVLSPQEMLDSDAIAVTFGNKILGFMSWVMPAFVATSALGALSVHIMTSARICFKAASVGLLPDAMALVSFKKTPAVALIFLGFLSLCYLVSSDVYALIEYSAFVEASFICLSVAALLHFRRTRPNAERPVKVPIIIPVLFLIMCLFLVAMPVYIRWQHVAAAVGITAAGVPFYLIFVKWNPKPEWIIKFSGAATVRTQKMFLSVPQEDYDGAEDDDDDDDDDGNHHGGAGNLKMSIISSGPSENYESMGTMDPDAARKRLTQISVVEDYHFK